MILFATPGIPEITLGLFPNLPNFIAHVLSTIVLIILLAKLVYKPFKNSIEDRRKKINILIDEAIDKTTKANRDKKEAEILLKNAKNDSLSIIKNANSEADTNKMAILERARREANNIQNHAKISIEHEREALKEEIRKNAIGIAFSAAEKVLEKNISIEENQKMIENFIEDLDKVE
ncbi:F0F1 ATP synthase subunit B [Spiroplasma sabaudiense Ar-1343]|uniref:ATP synthase subunit b n=1 Tax=Spiroplasma sabaudiense Ar-1343 TaxID=1276257 RepID=W6A8W9_9MOLU|nr:F0F1 ATP synthase subunit B [Spiroplasma sabaudiense]AHI53462.1 F0F1 ATP synthase subunit B [Spiroplasma sabaudiense Ar-1343]